MRADTTTFWSRSLVTVPRVIYRERMPVPGSMWQPWRALFSQSGGARAHFFANPAVAAADAQGRTADLLRAADRLARLQSMLQEPDTIVARRQRLVDQWYIHRRYPTRQCGSLGAFVR